MDEIALQSPILDLMTEAHKKNSEAEEKFAFAKIILGLDIYYY